MNHDRMRTDLLSVAMQLANLHGFGNVTRDMIANRAEVAVGTISYHFGTMKKLEAAMVERAIETSNMRVLGQALAKRHPKALAAPEGVRKAAALAMV